MIISDKQIMKLVIFAEGLKDILMLEKTAAALGIAEEIHTLLTEITFQQSTELREIK